MQHSFDYIRLVLNRKFTLLDDIRSRYFLVLLSALFATAFILIYDPLNISSFKINTRVGTLLSIYTAGIVGASALFVTQIFLRNWFKLRSFTIGTYLLWTIFEFIFIAIVIYLFFGERGLPFWNELALTTRFSIVLSFVPYTSSCLLIAVYQAYAPEAKQTDLPHDQGLRHLTLYDENGKVELYIRRDDIIFLKADDNYVEIHYHSGSSVDKKLIRNRFKNMEQYLDQADLIKIHRSYIINKNKIRLITRVGNKLELKLLHFDHKTFSVTPTYKYQFEQNELLSYAPKV